MPSIKCTAKLAKRAGFKLDPPAGDSPYDWHANYFTFDRKFYIIFVHDRTRLSCLAGPVKKPDLQELPKLLSQSLHTVLSHEGFSETTMNFALDQTRGLEIHKTNNRSVLGTINDNIFHIDYHLWDAGGIEFTTFAILAAHVNHMPMSPLKWTYPIKEYQRSLIHGAT